MYKPEIWTNEQFMSINFETRLLFMGIMNIADDNGLFKRSDIKIKALIFPADNVNITKMIDDLIKVKLVEQYVYQDVPYIWIVNFTKHQSIRHPTYICPIPPDSLLNKYHYKTVEITDSSTLSRSSNKLMLVFCQDFGSSITAECGNVTAECGNDVGGFGVELDFSGGHYGNPPPNIIKSNIIQTNIIKTKREYVDDVDLPLSWKIDFIETWNKYFSNTNTPGVKNLSDKRKRLLLKILKKHSTEEIEIVFRKIKESDFLQGKTKGRTFICTFDFFINENNFIKILEGNYDNKTDNNTIDFNKLFKEAEEMKNEQRIF